MATKSNWSLQPVTRKRSNLSTSAGIAGKLSNLVQTMTPRSGSTQFRTEVDSAVVRAAETDLDTECGIACEMRVDLTDSGQLRVCHNDQSFDFDRDAIADAKAWVAAIHYVANSSYTTSISASRLWVLGSGSEVNVNKAFKDDVFRPQMAGFTAFDNRTAFDSGVLPIRVNYRRVVLELEHHLTYKIVLGQDEVNARITNALSGERLRNWLITFTKVW